MSSKINFLVVIVVFFVTCGSAFSQVEDGFSLVKNGSQAPGFIVKTIQGTTIDIDKLKGKVILINFFATWCRPCMEEMPYIEQLHQRYLNSDLVVLSIGREHQLAELEIFNQSKGFTFKIAADPERKIYERYAEKMIPRNFVIDKRGNVAYQSSGYNQEDFAKMIKAIEVELKNY